MLGQDLQPSASRRGSALTSCVTVTEGAETYSVECSSGKMRIHLRRTPCNERSHDALSRCTAFIVRKGSRRRFWIGSLGEVLHAGNSDLRMKLDAHVVLPDVRTGHFAWVLADTLSATQQVGKFFLLPSRNISMLQLGSKTFHAIRVDVRS